MKISETSDALLRARTQQALIEKIRELPTRRLKAVRAYIAMIRALEDGWEMP